MLEVRRESDPSSATRHRPAVLESVFVAAADITTIGSMAMVSPGTSFTTLWFSVVGHLRFLVNSTPMPWPTRSRTTLNPRFRSLHRRADVADVIAEHRRRDAASSARCVSNRAASSLTWPTGTVVAPSAKYPVADADVDRDDVASRDPPRRRYAAHDLVVDRRADAAGKWVQPLERGRRAVTRE
jgi:hypothetical protein